MTHPYRHSVYHTPVLIGPKNLKYFVAYFYPFNLTVYTIGCFIRLGVGSIFRTVGVVPKYGYPRGGLTTQGLGRMLVEVV